MNFLTIIQDKCKRDGKCVAECPMVLIEINEKGSYPNYVQGAEKTCIACGHCVSVCPENAISLEKIRPEDCIPTCSEGFLSAGQIEYFLKSRRSIRRFRDRSVDRNLLEKVIDIARYAPSGHNSQPVHWLITEDKNYVKKLSAHVVDWMCFVIDKHPEIAASLNMPAIVQEWENGKDLICRTAPHIIFAHADAQLSTSRDSCIIALSYLELAAYSLGLGACWAGFLGSAAGFFPALIKELALPEGHQVFGAMMIGYPQYEYVKIPPRIGARITFR